MKKESKYFLKILKKLNPAQYKKIKKIKQEKELVEATKYLIISDLKTRFQILKNEIEKLKKSSKNSFYAEFHLLRVPSKIKYIEINFDKEEIKKLLAVYRKIEKEVKNAGPI